MVEQLFTTLNTGARMPLLGLGVYDMHGDEAERAVGWAIETGYRLFDTASMYGNEKEVGNAIRTSSLPRSEFFVTTKVADRDQGFKTTLAAFDNSLAKLNVGYIDLYLIHWPLRRARKQTWLALEHLFKEGKVKAIGVANYLRPFFDEMNAYGTIVPAVNQVEFSPYLYLKDLAGYCAQRRIQLQAYTPLVRGQRMKDSRLVSVARRYNRTPAQVILRWILQRGISAIPKSSNEKRIKENFDVFDFSLKAEDLSYIDSFDENLRVVDDPIGLL